MPIIYVHGVYIRDDQGWDIIETNLRRYIAPKLARDPENVLISRCFWGEHGAKFRFGGACTPNSPLRELMPKLKQAAAVSRALTKSSISKPADALMSKAQERLSEMPKTLPDAKAKLLLNSRESLKRSAHSAGAVAARAAAEWKAPMNAFVTSFIGDVLTYVNERGNHKAPGWIPSRFLACVSEARQNQLERDGEPIIVMSHSMGGQIVYDAVTHFMPRMEEFADTKIDFWVATASQVGLFEELKLFLESSEDYSADSGELVPFPDRKHLGYWWNVWDHNDFVSYSCRGIVDGVDDESYNTGLFIVSAHGGYLELPSFFRKFARKLTKALT